jgi:putative methyltransferase (TIGR04325 family)
MSQMKDLVKQLVPPLLLKSLKRAPPLFSSFDEAYKACPNGAYENESIVKVVVEKNRIFRQTIRASPIFNLGDLRTLIAVGLANTQGTLKVLDFGGGAGGYHYTIAKAFLGNGSKLKWNIVETPAMVKEGKLIADVELNFFDNISDAKNDLGAVDLVLSSGALQYCPNPLGFLSELAEVGAKNIFVTRIPLSESDKSLISIQVSKLSENGPGPLPAGLDEKSVSYPITFASRHEVEKILRERYEIVFSIKEDTGTYSAGKKRIDLYGYFCRLT